MAGWGVVQVLGRGGGSRRGVAAQRWLSDLVDTVPAGGVGVSSGGRRTGTTVPAGGLQMGLWGVPLRVRWSMEMLHAADASGRAEAPGTDGGWGWYGMALEYRLEEGC